MKNVVKRIAGVVLGLMMSVSLLTPVGAEAAGQRGYYPGGNANSQAYGKSAGDNWSSCIGSYLTEDPDGRLMRVEGAAVSGKILVEYYDRQYSFYSDRQIALDLPLFGGFYSDGDHYYVVTGQENPDEDNSKEVFCITKYDTDWNRISSCGLYGANTTVPFDAGTARMTKSGKWLIVHTSHEMYKNSEGVNHQAAVMILVDTDSMQITDSGKDLDDNFGWVSHSFNQFVLTDGSHIVTLDHGDAYPRAVVLNKYTDDFTTGKLSTGYSASDSVNMVDIPGDTGDNYTGYSVGGFEMSSNRYIACGTSDKDNNSYGASNIWVATVSRDLKDQPEVHYITQYTTEQYAYTPQLVKVSDDSFILLWQEKNEVHYCELDGNGQQKGEIYTHVGELSDCAPLVTDGVAIWYTWAGSSLYFYDINVGNLSRTMNREDLSPESLTQTEYRGCVNSEVNVTINNVMGKEGLNPKLRTGFRKPSDWNTITFYALDMSDEEENGVYSHTYSMVFPEKGEYTYDVYMGNIYKGTINITVGDHVYDKGKVDEPQNCVDDGQMEYTCTICGNKKYETIPADGVSHDYSKWQYTSYPTALKAGSRTRFCYNCDKEWTETVPKLKAKVSFRKKSYTVKKGKTLQTGIRYTTGDRVVKYTSSNSRIATVTKTGKIKAKKKGKVTIKVKMKSGVSAKCTVRIK